MQNMARSSTTAGWGAVVGVLLSLWGGSKAMKALIEGLNVMYGEEERRNFLKLNLSALLLTLVMAVGVIVAVGLVAVLPAAIGVLGLGKSTELLVSALRWPLLLVFFLIGLSVLYRFAPNRDDAQWKWVSWGALAATALWLAVSGLFSLYVTYFGSYNKTYGSLGGVVILLMWFYLSAYAVLLGAELNAEMERQTAEDTTKGAPQPMGRRGAHAADTLGKSPA
jgi:membrane protein